MQPRWYLLAGFASAVTLAAACEDPDIKLGSTKGLIGITPTDPGSPGTDSGPPPEGGGGGGCTPSIDASACPSFATDIYGKLMSANVWGCASPVAGCHAAGQGPTDPTMSDGADAVYARLMAHSGGNNKPYINPASNDPKDSSFYCDLKGATGTSCASPTPMPLANATNHTPTPDELTVLENWIRCCAPK
jgi:hypothetical protein